MNVVIFSLNRCFYAFPAKDVIQVLENSPVTPLPFVDQSIEGLVNVSGQVLPQFNLAAILRLPAENNATASSQIMMVALQSCAVYCTMRVDYVVTMLSLNDEQLHDHISHTEGPGEQPILDDAERHGHWVAGEFLFNDKLVVLLNPDSMGLDYLDVADLSNGTDLSLSLNAHSALVVEEKQETTESFLAILSQGEHFAIRLTDIEEVVEINQFSKLSIAPDEVLGNINLRGIPILIVSLSRLLNQGDSQNALGTPENDEGNDGLLIVIEYQSYRLGLQVEQVEGIVFVNVDNLQELVDFEGCFRGNNGDLVGVIDLHQLVTPERFTSYYPYIAELAQVGIEQEEEEELHKILIFEVADEDCAVFVDQVDGVFEYQTSIDLPESSEGPASGAIQIHGDILPVFDLRDVFPNRRENTPYTSFIVVNVDEKKWALVVDRVYRVIDVMASEFKCINNDCEHYGMVDSVVRYNNALLSMLSLSQLFETQDYGVSEGVYV